MARRRRGVGSRLLAGLGEGLANLGPMMLRQQQMDRMDERAAKSQQAILDRQQTMARESAAREILKEVAEGADPQSAVARLSALGINLDPSALDQVRPSPQRRMAPTVEKINAATNLAGVLPDESVLQAGRKENLFDSQFAGPMLEGEEGLAGFDPAVRDTVKTAGARRRSFLDAPEKVTRTNPDTGVNEMLTTSLGQLQNAPLAMGPTPEQAGVFKGQEEGGLLKTVGPARATQAGAEAYAQTAARNKADTTPEAIRGAAARAGAERSAQLRAEMSQLGITGQQQTAAMALADDFYNQSKDYYIKANSVKNIASMAQRIREARAKGDDSPASHIGLVFNFMKLQDPASTVREGEQAQVANAGGVEDRVRNLYNRVLLGGRLADDQVNDILNTAATQYKAEEGDQRARIQTFSERATMLRVPPSLVVREPDPSLMNVGNSAASRLRERQ